MEKFIVYKTTCTNNNKIYIGVHKTHDISKFDGYLGCGIQKYTVTSYAKHPKTAFHFAVNKYGLENFYRETLYIFDTAEEAYLKEAEIVNEDFLRRPDVYNIGLGGKMASGPRKKVHQFTLDGTLIKTWPGTISILKHFNLRPKYTQLYSHIAGNYEWKGYFWGYKNTIDLNLYTFNKVSSGVRVKVIQLTMDGKQVKIWNSVTELRKAGFSNVSGVLKGIRNKCKGYMFKYYDEDIVSSALKDAAV